MLKFWKKTSQKERNAKDSNNSSPSSTPWSTSPTSASGFLSIDLIGEIEEIAKLPTDKLKYPKHSRISKPLVHVLNDSEALSYFIQYLDSQNAATLAKCILDIDHFNASLTQESNLVYWNDVKGVRLTNDSSGQSVWEFSNGVEYTSSIACDISKKCEAHLKACICGCERTVIRAPTEAVLSQLELIENDRLMLLLSAEKVSETSLDGLRIFYKYFSYKAPFKIILSGNSFTRLVDNLCKNVTKFTFEEVRSILFCILDKEFYNDFLRSDYHCKYQMSVLTGNVIQVTDILYNEAALFYFTEYLEQEGCRGLLEFWIAANHFRELYLLDSVNYVQSQADAMVLYDKYFSLQATHPLNLGDKIRFMVEESICQEPGPLPTCFEHIQSLIVRLLETKFLDHFLRSQLYFNFLSELISTVNAGPGATGGSDCSSEASISVTNTLLVSEDGTQSKRVFKNWESGSLNIDTLQLYDPDSLWRQRKQAGLTFGRINPLGRFETDLEPEPDRKQGLESRITKAMKKLVNLEEDKSKEDMAWQVAEMIVKDVTSLTMPSSNR